MHFFTISRKTVTALYAYEIRQNAGCLVCTLFGGGWCSSGVSLVYALFLFPACCRGVQLVYALFGEIRNKYKKEGGKDVRFMYAHYGGKACHLVYALYAAKSEARRLV